MNWGRGEGREEGEFGKSVGVGLAVGWKCEQVLGVVGVGVGAELGGEDWLGFFYEFGG